MSRRYNLWTLDVIIFKHLEISDFNMLEFINVQYIFKKVGLAYAVTHGKSVRQHVLMRVFRSIS